MHFDGQRRVFWLYYFVPIGVPFVAFLLDRAQRWGILTWRHYPIDVTVVALSLARAAWPVPLISGHTLFLAYALLTTRSVVARVFAALVLVEVFVLKILVWHDWVTWIGGWLVASGAAFAFWRISTNQKPPIQEATLNG